MGTTTIIIGEPSCRAGKHSDVWLQQAQRKNFSNLDPDSHREKNLNKSAKEAEWDALLIVFLSLFSLKPAAQFLQGPGHMGMNEVSD